MKYVLLIIIGEIEGIKTEIKVRIIEKNEIKMREDERGNERERIRHD